MTEDEMVGWRHQLYEMSLNKVKELVMDREACCAVVRGVTNSQIQLSNWTELNECPGEGKRNPPQYSCLENPRDRGDWWAAAYGVAWSRTRLK